MSDILLSHKSLKFCSSFPQYFLCFSDCVNYIIQFSNSLILLSLSIQPKSPSIIFIWFILMAPVLSKVSAPVGIPTSNQWKFLLFHIFPSIWILSINRYVMVYCLKIFLFIFFQILCLSSFLLLTFWYSQLHICSCF